MKRKLQFSIACLTGIALFLLALGVQAIVIRHDTGYNRHTASESSFPAVFYLEQRARRKICVATLIHPRWAITAAHCTQETALASRLAADGVYQVRIGGQPGLIDRIVPHPASPLDEAAGQAGHEVDLALLRLARPLERPRPLPLYRDEHELDQTVTLLGWGYFGIGTRGIHVDDGQFRLARNRIDFADHRLQFAFDDPRQPNSQALEMEGLPGLGDSGGPALLGSAGEWQLAGVAVGELRDAARTHERQGLYGAIAVYERISRHLDWIDAVISASEDEANAQLSFDQ